MGILYIPRLEKILRKLFVSSLQTFLTTIKKQYNLKNFGCPANIVPQAYRVTDKINLKLPAKNYRQFGIFILSLRREILVQSAATRWRKVYLCLYVQQNIQFSPNFQS